jgi:phosphopantetheinyl transferase
LWDGVFAITAAESFELARRCLRPAAARLERRRARILRNDHDRQRYRDHDMARIEPSIGMEMGAR